MDAAVLWSAIPARRANSAGTDAVKHLNAIPVHPATIWAFNAAPFPTAAVAFWSAIAVLLANIAEPAPIAANVLRSPAHKSPIVVPLNVVRSPTAVAAPSSAAAAPPAPPAARALRPDNVSRPNNASPKPAPSSVANVE